MIRRVTPQDAQAIAAIYNFYVTGSTATFDTEPVRADVIRARIDGLASRFPWLVYEAAGGEVAGFCYAHPWKEKAAYRYTLETTVYLAPGYRGKNIGRRLMDALIDACRREDYRVLIACITAGNEASRRLYEKLGFEPVSRFEKVGLKFGRWLDVTDYELILSS